MNPDPLSTNDKPMTFKDAAIVSTVLTLIMAASVFMPSHGFDVATREPSRFIWDLGVFLFSSWISEFGILTGLTLYAKKQAAQKDQESAH